MARAIADDDAKAAASAAEKILQPIRAKLERLTPGGIPTPVQLQDDPQHWMEKAKELLGCCIMGAEIVPARRRANGCQSRPKLKILPRFSRSWGAKLTRPVSLTTPTRFCTN